ncbi:MAG TPA: response regulator transcription factor [Candidatus Copromorpha excrementigallinarum]|uniref:Stage 0 sporulation protein A homolog n=1 Tax=Candidatus Allocopromorpha excrementigallinarum TaxID=2840742 RepID=A0A9D1I1E9_9FIRM|nr:response regulator transcription factor [Candidatus Copromorpha excrementigallinarum]
MMKKILIVEDEPNIRELVLYNLKTNGYEGIGAEDGIMGITKVHLEKPDLILLDIMLPEKNGYDICRELREEGNNTPIIMITAKTEEVDKVLGLEFGADDYISKPFGIRELMARIKAVLRRYNVTSASGEEETVISVRDLNINVERHEVKVGQKEIDLTLKEFELLKCLMENRGHVFTRDQLLNSVWGIDYAGETRTVDVHIRHLRQKLSSGGKEDEYIETIRGKGYKAK